MDGKSFAKGITATLILLVFVGIAVGWSEGERLNKSQLETKDLNNEYLDCNPIGQPYANLEQGLLIQEVYCMDIKKEGEEYVTFRNTKKYSFPLEEIQSCVEENQGNTGPCVEMVKQAWLADHKHFKEEIREKAIEWQKTEITINPADFALTSQELN